MKVNDKKDPKKVMALIHLMMVQYILANGIMIKRMVKEYLIILMVILIQGIFQMEKNQVLVYIITLMVIHMKVNEEMISVMDQAHYYQKMAKNMLANGQKVKKVVEGSMNF